MRSRRKKKKINIKLIVVFLFFFGIISYLLFNLSSYIYQISTKNKEKKALDKQLVIENEQYLKYEKDISQLQLPEYLAKYAREKYSLSKNSEIIFKSNDK